MAKTYFYIGITGSLIAFMLWAIVNLPHKACASEYPSCTPTAEPTLTPTEEPTPTNNPCAELSVDVAPNAPCMTPTVTLEPTPTAGSSAQQSGTGISDGLSSCPECTKASQVPQAPPATGKAD